MSDEAQHAAHTCDELASALLEEVWQEGTLLLFDATGLLQASNELSALRKRVWHVHQRGCRLLHGTLQQLHDAGVETLLEGLDSIVRGCSLGPFSHRKRLVRLHSTPCVDATGVHLCGCPYLHRAPHAICRPWMQAMCLAHWHAVDAAQAELQRSSSGITNAFLQCVAATAAGFACAGVPGLLAIEPRLQTGLVSALDAPDQANPGRMPF